MAPTTATTVAAAVAPYHATRRSGSQCAVPTMAATIATVSASGGMRSSSHFMRKADRSSLSPPDAQEPILTVLQRSGLAAELGVLHFATERCSRLVGIDVDVAPAYGLPGAHRLAKSYMVGQT